MPALEWSASIADGLETRGPVPILDLFDLANATPELLRASRQTPIPTFRLGDWTIVSVGA